MRKKPEITSSYSARMLRIQRRALEDTVRVYRQALSFCIKALNNDWELLSRIAGRSRLNRAEQLIHGTSRLPAKYDFDNRFYKYPSYLRRATLKDALGALSSYYSNLANWERNGKIGKPPTLQVDRNAMPCFYYDNMYESAGEYTGKLKLLVNKDWVWVPVQFKHTDINYIRKYWSGIKASAPTLEKRYGKYYLRFSFKEECNLSETPVKEQVVCSVDLGLNTDAVCSILRSDGTVLGRKFINFPSEKDHLNTVLNRIKKFQREHGSKDVASYWTYARRLNDELAKKVASEIALYASSYGSDCIVFEKLSFKGKIKGSKKQRLHMWKKNSIQDYVIHKSHRWGMHVFHICAWGTSRLAFDGSGPLERNSSNHALATFKNGKQYNCDLSASYNIGARYFVRELIKTLPERDRSQYEANVPGVARRTECTLSTLITLASEMGLRVA